MKNILTSLLTVYINIFSAMVYADTYTETEDANE